VDGDGGSGRLRRRLDPGQDEREGDGNNDRMGWTGHSRPRPPKISPGDGGGGRRLGPSYYQQDRKGNNARRSRSGNGEGNYRGSRSGNEKEVHRSDDEEEYYLKWKGPDFSGRLAMSHPVGRDVINQWFSQKPQTQSTAVQTTNVAWS